MNVHEINNSTGGSQPISTGVDSDEAELHNLAVCAEIGGIAETNCHYSAGLSRHIAALGKPIEALTVGELLALHRDYNDCFNRVHATPAPDRRPGASSAGARAASHAG